MVRFNRKILINMKNIFVFFLKITWILSDLGFVWVSQWVLDVLWDNNLEVKKDLVIIYI